MLDRPRRGSPQSSPRSACLAHFASCPTSDDFLKAGVIFYREERILRRQRWREGECNLPVSDELDVLQSVTAQLEGAGMSDCGVMNDTSPDMEARYRAMIMERSGEERLKMGCSMFDTAKALMQAGILDQNPHASPAEIRRYLFRQLYGHEFDADSRTKILAAIESATHPVAK